MITWDEPKRRENLRKHRIDLAELEPVFDGRHAGGDYSDTRHTKREVSSEATRRPMHGKERRGVDYTPLFRFLLSKVGSKWREVHSEAVSRLDREEPVYWLVALQEEDRQEYVRVGESSFFSGLYVDSRGRLQVVNPSVNSSSMAPSCKCCTHTFNGVRFTQRFRRESNAT